MLPTTHAARSDPQNAQIASLRARCDAQDAQIAELCMRFDCGIMRATDDDAAPVGPDARSTSRRITSLRRLVEKTISDCAQVRFDLEDCVDAVRDRDISQVHELEKLHDRFWREAHRRQRAFTRSAERAARNAEVSLAMAREAVAVASRVVIPDMPVEIWEAIAARTKNGVGLGALMGVSRTVRDAAEGVIRLTARGDADAQRLTVTCAHTSAHARLYLDAWMGHIVEGGDLNERPKAFGPLVKVANAAGWVTVGSYGVLAAETGYLTGGSPRRAAWAHFFRAAEENPQCKKARKHLGHS